MSTLLILVILSVGAASFVWGQLGRATGNADQKNMLVISGFAGIATFIVLLTIVKGVLHQ